MFEDGRLRRRPSLVQVQRAVKSWGTMASGAGQGGTGSRGSVAGRTDSGGTGSATTGEMDDGRADRSHSPASCRKYRGSPTAFQRSLREWCGAVPPPRQVLDAAHSRRYQEISDARPDAATAVVECRKRRVSKNSTAHDQGRLGGLAASRGRKPSLVSPHLGCRVFALTSMPRGRNLHLGALRMRACFWKYLVLQQIHQNIHERQGCAAPERRPHEKGAKREQKTREQAGSGEGSWRSRSGPICDWRRAEAAGRRPPRPLETRQDGNLSGRGYQQTLVQFKHEGEHPFWRATSKKRGGGGASYGRLAGKLKQH